MNNIIEVKNLFKTIEKENILEDVNLIVKEGEIYGFLGPNGSGKTSLMKCLLTVSTFDSGEIKIFGKNLSAHREDILSKIGSLIESPIFYEDRTARQILEIHSLYMNNPIDRSEISNLLSCVGLKDTSKKVRTFSLGMRQRLGIARALLANPKLLILDEPINGLDPLGVHEIR